MLAGLVSLRSSASLTRLCVVILKGASFLPATVDLFLSVLVPLLQQWPGSVATCNS